MNDATVSVFIHMSVLCSKQRLINCRFLNPHRHDITVKIVESKISDRDFYLYQFLIGMISQNILERFSRIQTILESPELYQFLIGMISQDFLSCLYLHYKTFHKEYKFLS